MIQTKIKYQGRKVALRGFGFGKYALLKLGNIGVSEILKRVARGLGSDDSRMPELQGAYRGRKTREGARPFRDLRFTGEMMSNLSVRWASENQAMTAFSSAHARTAANRNQVILAKKCYGPGFLAYSPKDQKTIIKEAEMLFKAEVMAVREVLMKGGYYLKGGPRRLSQRYNFMGARAA